MWTCQCRYYRSLLTACGALADGSSQHTTVLLLCQFTHIAACKACGTNSTAQLKAVCYLWAVWSSLDFGTLTMGIKVSKSRQQSIDSKIYRIMLEDIVVLHLHCSFLVLSFQPLQKDIHKRHTQTQTHRQTHTTTTIMPLGFHSQRHSCSVEM